MLDEAESEFFTFSLCSVSRVFILTPVFICIDCTFLLSYSLSRPRDGNFTFYLVVLKSL